MKKALKVGIFAAAAVMMAFTGCAKKDAKSASKEAVTINLWSFTDEIPGMVDKYIAANPNCGFNVNTTIIATTDGAYQPALDQALQNGGKDAPDMYAAEAAFVLKYSKGGMQIMYCNTIDGNKDVYIGNDKMLDDLNGEYCGHEKNTNKSFIRTYL